MLYFLYSSSYQIQILKNMGQSIEMSTVYQTHFIKDNVVFLFACEAQMSEFFSKCSFAYN